MNNQDLFVLNPTANNLLNDGVVEIVSSRDAAGQRIIRHELQTFVCEGEYQRGILRILDTYLKNLDQPKQPAVWVSGFFGSGKSHLVKMLGFLWENFCFENGDTARSIKPLPTEISDMLTELDRKQTIYGKLSVSGTLKDFPSPDIRYSFMQLFLGALGLPTQYHHFKFVYWAKQEGIYDDLKARVEAAGKDFRKEYENLFVSTAIANAILATKPGFAANEAQVKEYLKLNFKRMESINRDELIRTIRDEALPLQFGNKIPCTVLVLDEVQQFIDRDGGKAIDVQNLAQDLCSQFDGRFLLIGTGQSSLSETPYLQPLQDRFSVKVSLSDQDVETVTRKTVLQKKPSVLADVNRILDAASGEIARNLSGTDFGYRTDDKDTLVADYPMLPSTRKFWKRVLQVIDTAGTSGQLRSQLRIVDESVKAVANLPLGHVVPADFIFEQKQSQLLQNALLLNETNNLILDRKAKGGDSLLEGRILSAVFLIDRLPQEVTGGRVRSDENTIADLLLADLTQPADSFRQQVKALIGKLVTEKILMPIGTEFKLQTKVGAEWEQEFTAQATKLNNSGDDRIQQLRRDRLVSFIKDSTKTINIQQGIAREKREFTLHTGTMSPSTSNQLNLWVRDGWFENEATVLNEIRAEGPDAPLAYAYVRKQRDADLRTEIIKALAADLTLQSKGIPTTPEGEQARQSMETRKSMANQAINDIIAVVGRDALVYLAGGNDVSKGALRDSIEEALKSLADRQFPEFAKADYKDWDKALAKAFAGDPDALKRIGYDKDPKDHPVAADLLRFMGTGTRTGKDIRVQFEKAPYGWSRDAIDTVVVVLKNAELISTSETALNQSKLGAAVFKREVHTLTAPQKIKLRKLYQDAGLSVKPNEEFAGSNALINTLRQLADHIGGDSPRPEPMTLNNLKTIENLDGNERLLQLLEQADALRANFTTWSQQATLVATRLPHWYTLINLLAVAPNTTDLTSLRHEVDAIRNDRLLLAQPDPVEPLLNRLTNALKTALTGAKQRYIDLFDTEMAALQDNQYFKPLTPDQKHQILVKQNIVAKPKIEPVDADGLLVQLQKVSLDAWQTKLSALPSQFQAAIDEAVALSAPKAKSYILPKRTLNSQTDIDTYITELKAELEAALSGSSAVILR